MRISSLAGRALQLAFFLSVSLSAGAAPDSTPSTLDFAFPKTVITQSETALKSAISSGNDIKALRAVLDYTLAQNSIGTENIPSSITLIKDTRPALKSPQARAFLDLLLARVYQAVYQTDQYIYNNRQLPISPLPADYTEWSGAQFRKVISDLLTEALLPADQLNSTPLSDYASLVEVDRLSSPYFPTLYDFLAHQAIEIRSSLSPFSSCVGLLSLTPKAMFIINPGLAPSSQDVKIILDTYARLLNYNRNNPAAEIYSDIARINFVYDNLYSNLRSQAQNQRAELLRDLYNDYLSITPYSGDALSALYNCLNDNVTSVTKSECYALANDFIKHYPSYDRIGCIKSIVDGLSQVNISATFPGMVAPNKEFDISLTSTNANSGNLLVYKVPDPKFTGVVMLSDLKNLSPVKTIPFTAEGTIPFVAEINVKATLPEFGCYVIVPERMRKKLSERGADSHLEPLYCTELTTGTLTDNSADFVFVINPLTGAPVKEAYLNSTKNYDSPFTRLGRSDSDGFFKLADNFSGRIRATKGEDKYSPSRTIYSNGNYDEDGWRTTSNAFTDLPLYRPGDKVDWCAVIYRFRQLNQALVNNAKVTIVLMNANDLPIDTIESVTDEWGRTNGSFVIPKGELTGQYHLVFKVDGKSAGYHYFEVSDYKLPTYYIKLDKPASGVPSDGDVTLSGTTVTYSGVPLSGIPVSAVISASTGRWWFRSNPVTFCTLADTTDTEGRFTMVLTKEMIESSPAPQGLFSAYVSATSLSGESREASTDFNVGLAYQITSTLPSALDISRPVDFASYFRLMTSDGKPADSPLAFRLTDRFDNNLAVTGTLSQAIDLKDLRGSTYILKVYPTEVKADTFTVSRLILYHPDEAYSPVDSPLWSPDSHSSIAADSRGKASVRIFASADKTPVLLITVSDTAIVDRRWITLCRGVNHLNLEIPSGLKKAKFIASSTIDYHPSTLQFRLEKSDAVPTLGIFTETFRDRLVPGQQETWTFRTINTDSVGRQSAVILDMYNSAFNSLVPKSFALNFSQGYVSAPQFNTFIHPISLVRDYADFIWSDCGDITSPSLLTYGMPFTPVMRYPAMRMYKSAAMATVGAVNEDRGTDRIIDAAETKNTLAKVEAEEAAPKAPQAAAGRTASAAEDNFAYRQSEVPLAFFAPELTTDEHGFLSFTFTVPNANTSWTLGAMAYDRDLASATITREVIANKPLMVQPNLPRFLRAGDEATVSATVLNNSDSPIDATVDVTVFDPVTMQTLQSYSTAVNVAANAQAAVSENIVAPSDAPFIGYRIKATAGNCSDGEQAMIPILAASQEVYESQPFYVSPDSTEFTMKLPEYPADAQLTLQFCDNPTWYVVTALPGISANEARTAPQAAAAIFSAAVADGLLRSNPQIASALRQWTASDQSDSTLVSMLERNSDLKIMLLKATPWMLDARNDTERMQRLALLFDKDNIRKAFDSNIDLLKKLSRPDGGFAWFGNYDESSSWATYQTLYILGRLNQLGFLPSDKTLVALIKDALAYNQKVVEKAYGKSPKADYTDFVILRDFWPAYKPSVTGQRIIAANVQKQIASWKKAPLTGKITAALILQRHGYQKVAATILSSLSQFAKSSPEKGMYWPLTDDYAGGTMTQLLITARALEAYSLISPSSPDIDAIRQWLILQKEARDWGNASSASDVAATILLTSPRWIEPAKPVKVYVGNEEIKPSSTEQTIGYFRTPLDAAKAAGSFLHIIKSDKTPAWGAIFSRSNQVMKDVKAASCPDLSIEKQLFVRQGDTWAPAEHLKVGDRVKVQLVIHAGRAIDYVAIDDNRAACLEPVDQLPTPVFSEGLCFYRENGDNATRLFISSMPKGTYLLTYEMWVNNAGSFASGIATIQSQYAPQLSAHSAGSILSIDPAAD